MRKLNDSTVCGFAGSAADCLAIYELLEAEFERYPNQTLRACLSLAKQWRTNKFTNRLSADMLVSDQDLTVLLDGSGNCIEIEEGSCAIGSGGLYAHSAATALLEIDNLDAEDIARRSMKIAADLCLYTNHNFTIEIVEKSKEETTERNRNKLDGAL